MRGGRGTEWTRLCTYIIYCISCIVYGIDRSTDLSKLHLYIIVIPAAAGPGSNGIRIVWDVINEKYIYTRTHAPRAPDAVTGRLKSITLSPGRPAAAAAAAGAYKYR